MITGKNILIVSPERWGDIFLSKHHYAQKLSQMGNRVFFLHQPYRFTPFRLKVSFSIPSHDPLITIVDYTYPLKGHLRMPSSLTSWVYRKLIHTIEKAGNVKIDLIWCFDTSTFAHWDFTPKKIIRILHLVDFNLIEKGSRKLFMDADLVFCSSKAILNKALFYNKQSFFINHGLSIRGYNPVVNLPCHRAKMENIKVGYVGNLLITYIDWEIVTEIIRSHPDIEFHFFGPYEESNIGNYESGTGVKERLSSYNNVILHGTIPAKTLLGKIRDMDMFIVAYDSDKHLKQLSNPHKILELLVTGRVILSNKILEYEDKKELLVMAEQRGDLPGLFDFCIQNLKNLNNPENQKRRIEFALNNTYEKQIERIGEIMNGASIG